MAVDAPAGRAYARPMTFRTRMPVRFGDEDHVGIVYYPRIFHFLHVAFEDFFNEQGIAFRELFEVDRLGFPMAHVDADFKSPLRLGDVLEVDVWIEKVGDASVTFQYRGRRSGEDALAVTACMTVVCIDLTTFRSRPIPPRYRKLFEANRAAPPGAPAG